MRNFSAEEICLFLDVDGTLVDIAPRPEDVIVPLKLVSDLVRATQRLDGALALVSGRSIETLDRLFRPLHLSAAGVHGAELRIEADGEVKRAASATLRPEFRQKFQAFTRRFPGAIVEDKGASVAVHYRFCADRRLEISRAIQSELAQERDPSLAILPGHFVYEVKHKQFDKGTALAAFLQADVFSGRKPVVIGDDVTDEAAFRVAVARGGYAFSVGREVEGVSGLFNEPRDVRRWLNEFANTDVGDSASLAQAG